MTRARIVTSPHNPLLVRIRRAVERGSLTEDGFAVCEGPHLYEEAVRSGCGLGPVVAAVGAKAPEDAVRVPPAVFKTLKATEHTQGLVALVRPPEPGVRPWAGANALVAVLDQVQDPGNAGAILRAAEAFGATGAVFLKGSVNPYNPKCLRAAAGSHFRLPVLSAEKPPGGLSLLAAVAHGGTPVGEADLRGPVGIVFGSEGRGVRGEIARHAPGIRIPTSGVESLNVAAAAAVIFYEAYRQRTALS